MKNEQRKTNDGIRYGGRKEIRAQIDNEIDAIEKRLETGYIKVRAIEEKISQVRAESERLKSKLARTQLMDAISLGRAHKLSDDHIELIAKASIDRCGIEWGEEIGREFETFLKQNQK
jgi:hypothetical protein